MKILIRISLIIVIIVFVITMVTCITPMLFWIITGKSYFKYGCKVIDYLENYI